MDERIGHGQLRAGIGYGGSCFPKDLAALVNKGKEVGYEAALLGQVIDLNNRQPLRMLEILKKYIPSLKG
jgi:UDPglucose 6-dehydrogenase